MQNQLHGSWKPQTPNQQFEPIHISVKGTALLVIGGALKCEGGALCLVWVHELGEKLGLKGGPVWKHVGVVLQNLLCQISHVPRIHVG